MKIITPTFKIPINFEMFQAYTKFLKNIFGFIVDGVIATFKSKIRYVQQHHLSKSLLPKTT